MKAGRLAGVLPGRMIPLFSPLVGCKAVRVERRGLSSHMKQEIKEGECGNKFSTADGPLPVATLSRWARRSCCRLFWMPASQRNGTINLITKNSNFKCTTTPLIRGINKKYRCIISKYYFQLHGLLAPPPPKEVESSQSEYRGGGELPMPSIGGDRADDQIRKRSTRQIQHLTLEGRHFGIIISLSKKRQKNAIRYRD